MLVQPLQERKRGGLEHTYLRMYVNVAKNVGDIRTPGTRPKRSKSLMIRGIVDVANEMGGLATSWNTGITTRQSNSRDGHRRHVSAKYDLALLVVGL
jgi:hypothetical protein